MVLITKFEKYINTNIFKRDKLLKQNKAKRPTTREGIIDGRPLKKKTKSKNKDKTKNHHKTTAPYKKEQKELSITMKEPQKNTGIFLINLAPYIIINILLNL